MPRQCPFCKEEINEDAIKCKHCLSLLYQIETSSKSREDKDKDSSKYTTYVLDKDLVRFSKFALSILAIFITVGIILYGVDLKQTAKELNEANANLDEANKKIASALPKIDSLELQIGSIKREVEDTRLKANAALADINSSKEEATVLVGYIRDLNPEQLDRLSEIKSTNSEKFNSKLDFKNLWKPGQTIRIFLINGTQTQREKVKKISSEWTHFANLRFEFINNKQNSEIRINFDEYQMWSFVGTNCLAILKDQPTMSLTVAQDGPITSNDRLSVLREFGFAIGLMSEQQNPNSNIKWNTEKVYKEFSSAPYFWSKAFIEGNVLGVWSSKSKPFDPQSVMMLAIPKELTLNGFHSEINDQLSQIDKEFISRLYPK
jgi:serralysin